MIKAFSRDGERLKAVDFDASRRDIVWVDLLRPTDEEERQLEAWLGVGIPTRAEMDEIEVSSRLYADNGALFMTVTLPAHSEAERPEMGPVSFVLSGGRLVTIRYHEPRSFDTFPLRAGKLDIACTNGDTVLVALLETIVDRLADLIEKVGASVIEISRDIFHPAETKASKRDRNYQIILRRIGRKEEFLSGLQDSLLTLQRLSGFLAAQPVPELAEREVRGRLKTLGRDIVSLIVHAESLSQKITFLLEATLGMINIQQNNIIKIVSVAAVVFLPPTLVASVYGMNFAHMPELGWEWGYPLALLAMAAAAVVPLWVFRRIGWL
ncbi:MAG: magnesium transporter CorA family protein [Rhizobiaceae bacterium]|nr:magnesium transporter CorA family protein [Rhizobiaceae bacterium]